MTMKTVTTYKKSAAAIEDIKEWYYDTFYVKLTTPQVLSYSIATVDMEQVKSVDTIAKMITPEMTMSVSVTNKAHSKLEELRKGTNNSISMPLLTSLILLLKSLSLPTPESSRNIMRINKKRADTPPSELLKKIGLR